MTLCHDSDLQTLVAAIQSDDANDLHEVDRLLTRFPDDPRLHFMRGSILAGRQQAILAHDALARAVELAPDFHLARYQLGFFELTSGEADRALSTWGPLLRLAEDHYLRRFVEGLIHLVRDEFDEAITEMEQGITLNQENEPLNNDIRLLLAECRKLAADSAGKGPGGDGDLSATSLLLGQFIPGSRH